MKTDIFISALLLLLGLGVPVYNSPRLLELILKFWHWIKGIAKRIFRSITKQHPPSDFPDSFGGPDFPFV